MNLVALSELETEAHVWVGLLRDKDISLRSHWYKDAAQALEHAQTHPVDLLICALPPSADLIKACHDKGALCMVFVDCTTHQAASWLGAGALSVMPYAQAAALVPITLRELSQRTSLKQARQSSASKSEHEARLNLLLQRSGMALAYLTDTHYLNVSDGWARWLGQSIEALHQQRWAPGLPADISQNFLELVARAQQGDGVEGRVTLNDIPRQLRLEPATFAGQACLMATLTAPTAQASVDVSSRVSEGGIQQTIRALSQFIQSGGTQTLVLVEVKQVSLLRHSLSLVDFSELMGLTQARISQVFDQPPEPVNDHSFITAVGLDGPTTQTLAQQLIDGFARELLAPELPHIECAVALVPLQSGDDDVSALLQRAYDLVGRTSAGEVSLFKPTTLELSEKDPLAGLRNALEQDQCELLYQPMVALTAVPGEYYEVLTQLRDEQGNVTPAKDFIRDAGRKDLGRVLDEYVIQNAAQRLIQHLPRHPDTRLVLNLTLASLQSDDLAHRIQALALGVSDASALTWQFRETDIALDVQTAALQIKALRGLGFQVGCAQFGNLPNSHKLLAQCQFDTVKVDPSFVEGIKGNADKQAELATLCEQIHEAGARVIVPMVEEPAIMSALYRAGADLIQGHYLQPPEREMNYEFATEI